MVFSVTITGIVTCESESVSPTVKDLVSEKTKGCPESSSAGLELLDITKIRFFRQKNCSNPNQSQPARKHGDTGWNTFKCTPEEMDTNVYQMSDLGDTELHWDVSDLNLETNCQQSFRKAETIPYPYNFHIFRDRSNGWKHNLYWQWGSLGGSSSNNVSVGACNWTSQVAAILVPRYQWSKTSWIWFDKHVWIVIVMVSMTW